ncbi:MAG: signal peptidase II [Tenericutes bacterium]|nr:signal peptidase II [Mycoplasmatota bacterium]
MQKKYIKTVLIIIFLVFIDQILKLLLIKNLNINEEFVIINNFLKFIYIKNTGAAFGIFSGSSLLLIVVASILIWYLISEIKNNINSRLSTLSLSLVLSGAFGNLIDRVFRGHVIDYISFTILNKEMAIFNFADILITFGVLILIYIMIKEGKNEKDNNKSR